MLVSWRRVFTNIGVNGGDAVSEHESNALATTEDRIQGIVDTVDRANCGDESALADVRRILDESPDLIEFLGGDLAATAEAALISAATGERLAMAEALRRNLRQIEDALAGGSSALGTSLRETNRSRREPDGWAAGAPESGRYEVRLLRK
jgi:hypothetical protein